MHTAEHDSCMSKVSAYIYQSGTLTKKSQWYTIDYKYMLKIKAGEQEKSEIYIYFFFVLGALQCVRTVICACNSNACKRN